MPSSQQYSDARNAGRVQSNGFSQWLHMPAADASTMIAPPPSLSFYGALARRSGDRQRWRNSTGRGLGWQPGTGTHPARNGECGEEPPNHDDNTGCVRVRFPSKGFGRACPAVAAARATKPTCRRHPDPAPSGPTTPPPLTGTLIPSIQGVRTCPLWSTTVPAWHEREEHESNWR